MNNCACFLKQSKNQCAVIERKISYLWCLILPTIIMTNRQLYMFLCNSGIRNYMHNNLCIYVNRIQFYQLFAIDCYWYNNSQIGTVVHIKCHDFIDYFLCNFMLHLRIWLLDSYYNLIGYFTIRLLVRNCAIWNYVIAHLLLYSKNNHYVIFILTGHNNYSMYMPQSYKIVDTH